VNLDKKIILMERGYGMNPKMYRFNFSLLKEPENLKIVQDLLKQIRNDHSII
jgi:hypothetical protein